MKLVSFERMQFRAKGLPGSENESPPEWGIFFSLKIFNEALFFFILLLCTLDSGWNLSPRKTLDSGTKICIWPYKANET